MTLSATFSSLNMEKKKKTLISQIYIFKWEKWSLKSFVSVYNIAIYFLTLKVKYAYVLITSFQSLSQVWLCDPMNHRTSGLPVHHQLPESTQTHVQGVGDAIQPSHPLLSPSPSVLNLSQHQGLFKWVSSSHQVAKVLEFQLQHQSFQWTPRTDLL